MKDVWSKRNVNLVLLIIGVSLNRVWLRSVVTSLLDQIHQFDLLDNICIYSQTLQCYFSIFFSFELVFILFMFILI